MSEYHPLYCFICANLLDDGQEKRVVKQKGINGLIAKSKLKKDDKWKCLNNLTQVTVHEKCRVAYNLSKKVADQRKEEAGAACGPVFSFEIHCTFCQEALDGKHNIVRKFTSKVEESIKQMILQANGELYDKVCDGSIFKKLGSLLVHSFYIL